MAFDITVKNKKLNDYFSVTGDDYVEIYHKITAEYEYRNWDSSDCEIYHYISILKPAEPIKIPINIIIED